MKSTKQTKNGRTARKASPASAISASRSKKAAGAKSKLELERVSSATAKGARPYQEDRSFFLTAEEGMCFGVFDGHGGESCSDYLSEEFPTIFIKALEDMAGEPAKYRIELALKEAFTRANVSTQWMGPGSTGSVVFLPWNGKSVTVAVIGDSPVIVRKADGNIWVAPEHNVRTNKKEADAAVARGGVVTQNGYLCHRWNGPGLQMARAFGDSALNQVLSRVPDVETVKLGNKSWVLVATDGALDPSHANEAEGIKALTQMINEGVDAQAIVDRAVGIPTEDNVTAMLVRINKA